MYIRRRQRMLPELNEIGRVSAACTMRAGKVFTEWVPENGRRHQVRPRKWWHNNLDAYGEGRFEVIKEFLGGLERDFRHQ